MVHICKMVMFPDVFFHFFEILIFWAVKGVKGQKKPKMKNNNSICHAPYLRNSRAYDHVFWYTGLKWWYLQVFFQLFKILIFGVVVGVRWQKMVQNDKKFCLSHFISQEPYIIWLSSMVHMCKMIISPGIFFSFLKFWVFGLLGGLKGQKNGPNWQKILFITLHISGTIHHMIVIYGTYV